MKPEEKARLNIDRWLTKAGWFVCSRSENTTLNSAVAVKEALMKRHLEADYLLFLNGKAVAVLEAKREENLLDQKVQEQVENYAYNPVSWCPYWERPIPLVYISNGKEILFKNLRNPKSEYQSIPEMHRPIDIVRILGIEDKYIGLPILNPKGLRECQYRAISHLESSLKNGNKRALIVLATGAGKTFTACLTAYRQLMYTPHKRILFLVDRNNLGTQALGEFGRFRLTASGEALTTEYLTEKLTNKTDIKNSAVVVSTIQKLYSVLSGSEIDESDDDENEWKEDDVIKELPENPTLPSDIFDIIIIDECHRSIYGTWGKVLNYFDSAIKIGLTATPSPDTSAFFNNNIVENYTLEQSIIDGVNVDGRVYSIKTQVTEQGGNTKAGETYTVNVNATGENRVEETPMTYSANEVNRSVFNPTQIRTILEEYKKVVYSEFFPEREPNFAYLPKTLIFAENDKHATMIRDIAREVFANQHSDFVQKITHAEGNSIAKIKNFQQDKNFRIAVTVTLVATGTDVKSLEVLIFMRDVQSASLFTQMKGRGVRTLSDDELRVATPNADSKREFFLVDAVGVTEHEHSIGIIENKPSASILTLAQLLERLTMGEVSDANLRLLASRLASINNRYGEKEQEKFKKLTTTTMEQMAKDIYAHWTQQGDEEIVNLPPYLSINDENEERKLLVRLLTNSSEAKAYLLELSAGYTKILMPGEDQLIYSGFSKDDAKTYTALFEQFLAENKDKIEALRMIYNGELGKLSSRLLIDLKEKMHEFNKKLNASTLWQQYALLYPERVENIKTQPLYRTLADLISLVRFAIGKSEKLISLQGRVAQRFELWCGQNQRPLTAEQKALFKTIAEYIGVNGACSTQDFIEQDAILDKRILLSLKKIEGSMQAVNQQLHSLSSFLLAA